MTFKATRQTVQTVVQTASESIFRVSRVMVDDATSSGVGILAKRETDDIPFAWTYSEENGGSVVSVSSLFPSGEYAELNYTPTWSGHRFIGWFPSAAAPSQAVPDMTGAVTKDTSVTFSITAVHARWQLPHTVTFDAGDGTISGSSSITVYEGQLIGSSGTLPSATKEGEDFLGWRDANGGVVTMATVYSASMGETFTAAYTAEYGVLATKYTVTTTSSFNKTGIYSATRHDSSIPILISWGDGETTEVDGDISQLTHTYATVDTFTVGISDNISSLQLSASNSTWYNTTSQNQYTLKSVTALSSKIADFPSYCFYYCDNLESFVWPENATVVNDYTFSHTMVHDFTIPSGIASIGTNAFSYNYSDLFSSVAIPDGVTSIGGFAFSNCTYLSVVSVPSSVTSIGNYAFESCSRLSNVTFDFSAETLTLGWYAFYGCGSASEAMSIDLSSRSMASIPRGCFFNCIMQSLKWPQGVTSIDEEAFGGSGPLWGTLSVPEGVVSAGSYAFTRLVCATLELPSTLETLGDGVLGGAVYLSTLIVKCAAAPSLGATPFGTQASAYGSSGFTGFYSAMMGNNNRLIVPVGATGYDKGAWRSPLCAAGAGGFVLEEQEFTS